MQVIGQHEKVELLTLTHKGCDFHYQHINHNENPFEGNMLERMPEAKIVFEDLQEVDMLIAMLKDFREGCNLRIGEFCRFRRKEGNDYA